MKPSKGKLLLTRPKRRMFRLMFASLLLSVTLLILIGLELIASFFATLPGESFTRDVRLNHTWARNTTYLHKEWIESNPKYPEPYLHRYNSQGWVEESDIKKEKPSNVYRIFYVGDSFTEGCVPMEENLPTRVERALNSLPEDEREGLNFEVINTGTSSYSPLIYYILTRYYLFDYRPDAIVVNIDMTDCFDDWKYRQTLVTNPDGTPQAVPPRNLYQSSYVDTVLGATENSFLSRVKLFLTANSRFYNWISHDHYVLEQQTTDAPSLQQSRWAWCEYDWDEKTEEQVKSMLATLELLADLCAENEITLAWSGVPHYQQFAATPGQTPEWSDRPHRELESLARKKGVFWIESLEPLRKQFSGTAQDRYYYRDNMHLNPEGNAAWAEIHCLFFCEHLAEILKLRREHTRRN